MDRTAEALARFSAPTREWFTGTFPRPTPAQEQAWNAIADGEHTLVIAPTGSGKTLAAFLWAIDSLARDNPPGKATRVLYISPLKALAVDVEQNLRTPLTGITRVARRHGLAPPAISTGVRSGDSSPRRRRELVSAPPDILITTPESLFLMLTSAARATLAGVHTVIVDEVHAVAGTKRGAHLALSLERLDAMLTAPAQRVGLSATVRPAEEVARFLAGGKPVRIVAPPAAKTFDISVQVPVPDLANLETPSLWPDVEERIVDLIEAHRSSIVFANSRRLAERLTARLNEIHADRVGPQPPGHNPGVPGGAPAHVMGSGQTHGAAPVLARAHHGSVSLQARAEVEDALRTGQLRAVVATSSLELGIDMGTVDLVIQVEAPPSVASGLQRIGRAGHQVGEISRGVLIPKHRTDLIGCAVTVARMLDGNIETLRVPANPLDVLAQHTVAACALEPLNADVWFDVVRRCAPFAALPRAAFEATMDLLSGKYPSTEFAELRPRVVYDRDSGTVTARPGAQRLAVTSGGAIPDRGLFTVYLTPHTDTEKPSRVGELDEEMVYESRPGDVISLGATSWRITDITHDRVLVVPAPGQPARLPFWRGDAVGRPAELGAAIGAFNRQMSRLERADFDRCCADLGFDDFAIANLWRLLDEQRSATAAVPSDTTLVVERFRDELGDWRVILHSPYGLRVHGPLALMVGSRLRRRYGIDDKPTAFDDGIVVRLPDTSEGDETQPGADLFVFDPDDVETLVTEEVGGSALFAARFRECAARALLLPRRHPGKRSPLWHQRRRAAQLLDVARRYPDFPIVLEAVRECLQDVYDVPALRDLMARIAERRVTVAVAETVIPSPFAASLLFGYVGAFMYEGDSPLAERRAAALSLDTTLLAELLGRVELRELLDPEVVAATGRQLQHLTPQRAARDAEGVADLLRLLGPLTDAEIAERSAGADVGGWLDGLHGAHRVVPVAYAGRSWWVAIEDIARLRDGVGIAVPPAVPRSFLDPVTDPLRELLGRFARTHGPFSTTAAAERFGLGLRVTADTLSRLTADGTLVRGEFTDGPAGGPGGQQWCDTEVLRILRRRSLAALRSQIEPVSTAAYARFLPAWQQVGPAAVAGVDGLATVIEQLAGVPLPASAVEPLVFAARVRDYQPSMLDELLASGEVLWSGAGTLSGDDGWVAFHPADTASLTLAHPGGLDLTDVHRAILGDLSGGGAFFFRQLAGDCTDSELKHALWQLIWSGRITGDTFAPVRARLAGTRRAPTHRAPRTPRLSGYHLARPAANTAVRTDATVAGRFSALPDPEADSTVRAHFQAELLLGRYGVLTRGPAAAEDVSGGFAMLYKVLSALEESGRCQRGYFVESLGGAQFATAATVDRLRTFADPVDGSAGIGSAEIGSAVVLAAADPANPYGAALPWPARGADAEPGHRPGRKAGALVVLVDGELAWFVERGGRTLLSFTENPVAHAAAATAVAGLVTARRLDGLLVQRIDGVAVLDPAAAAPHRRVAQALAEAGFARTPRGLRLR